MTDKPSSSPSRIGIFGGTFDPIHSVHLRIGEAARLHGKLDRVYFVVAAKPPHKPGDHVADGLKRFAMVEAALRDHEHLEASSIELDRPGVSYTADTLRAMSERFPGAALFLIVGQDALIDLPNWNESDAIMDLAHILVIERPGQPPIPESMKGRYTIVPFDPADESSTNVRATAARGGPLEGRVPEGAEQLIREHGLYNGDRKSTGN